MKKIEVGIVENGQAEFAETMMVTMARLTQRGHKLTSMGDVQDLLQREYDETLVKKLISLPHPTIQKFGTITVIVVGASRRFLAQITRHQNEVKFMSASLQYSDYSGSAAQFVVPYEIIRKDAASKAKDPEAPGLTAYYLSSCLKALEAYENLAKQIGNDAAGYAMPQGLRNVLVISATAYQWKHMISQRTCRRNTLETQYVLLRCWELLYEKSVLFSNCGPSCLYEGCNEGSMSCGQPIEGRTPEDILREDFELLMSEV